MKAEFKREMNRNYMILTPEKGRTGSYMVRMMAENRIAGILPFQEKCMDGETFLCFDITSRQSLARMMEYRSFREEEIRRLLKDLIVTMRSMERFLVDGDQLCLEPDMIYVDPDDLQADFCLLPGEEETFTERFRKLSRYILDHVDHTDGNAVVLAFALFRAGERDNMGILDLEKCLEAGEVSPSGTNPTTTDSGRSGVGAEFSEGKKLFGESYGQFEKHLDRMPDWAEKKQTEASIKEKNVKKNGEEKKEELGEKVPSQNEKGKRILQTVLLILMAILPLGTIAFFGIDGIRDKKWIILAVEGILAAENFFFDRRGKVKTEETGEEDEEEDWEVSFREEEEKEGGGILNLDGVYLQENPDRYRETKQPEQTERCQEEPEMQTMLLTGHQIYPVSRKLVSESTGEIISVPYFPFLVGKNKEIADLCLNLPQISRMHAKIEENGDGYQVTDLNSTNGTYVNGRLLGNNESCALNPGETVSFADLSYRFL